MYILIILLHVSVTNVRGWSGYPSEGKSPETGLDINNCNAIPLPNSTGVASILGIEFDDNDNLWAFDECCVRKLHQIDTTTEDSY